MNSPERKSAGNGQRSVQQQSADDHAPGEATGPATIVNEANAGLRALMEIEAGARAACTREELQFIVANETRKLTQARQIFVFTVAGKMRLVTISGLPTVDRAAPLVRDIEQVVDLLGQESGHENHLEFELSPESAEPKNTLNSYPFRRLLWVPFLAHNGAVLGGMLLAREQAWSEPDIAVAERLAGTFAHALAFLIAEPRLPSRLGLKSVMRRRVAIAAIIGLPAVMAVPVSMTTLAPFEIAAHNPFVVAAPIEGVIEDVLVNPSAEVKEGQPIVRFADTILRNRLEVAEREVLVAEARLKKASQLAFDDVRGRHELRLAMAHQALKMAELNFARDMFDRTTIKAQRAGIALYSDKRALIGKPVTLGERIMQIGDPSQIEIAIDVAVGDSIVLKPGARAKIFLDSDPIHSREAKVEFTDYQARATPGGTLAFRVVAKLAATERNLPRLGVRGTAQIYGERVLLAVYLFRRPLSALRQWIGL